ncbi:MAG: glucosyl-3-phosphoglycerate synthase [Thermoflexales bacterium]
METHAEPLNIFIPITAADQAQWLMATAAALSSPNAHGSISVLGLTHVDEGQPISSGTRAAQHLNEQLQALFADNPAVSLLPQRVVASQPWPAVNDIVREHADENTLLLLPWNKGELYAGIDVHLALQAPPCDMAVFSPIRGRKRIRRILLPVRGGSFAALGANISLQLARQTGARITLMHVHGAKDTTNSSDMRREFAQLYSSHPEFSDHVHVSGDPIRAIMREMRTHQAIVIGASAAPGAAISPLALKMLPRDDVLTLVIRTRAPFALSPLPAEPALAAPRAFTSYRVDKWFAEHTFHSREFADIGKLVDLKRRQNLTISLGLPALNEAETVGNVISTIKSALVDDAPLLDEIVLIDSNSSDGTREIAEACGVPWVIHQDLLPDLGGRRGKGEALWKSLHALRGDLIAWIDTDIVNIHPRFVYGILGPLIVNPKIQFVKGFYQRPIRVGDRIQAAGGGRVTELLARPIINMFYPELSGFAQPLSGEYAGRREAFERIPFYSGYGVETGMLLELLNQFGLDALSQVDLEERVHRNQELQSLSKMSFALLQVFMEHMAETKRIQLLGDMERTMKLLRSDDSAFYLEEIDIVEQRRPPMRDVAEYAAARAARLGA